MSLPPRQAECHPERKHMARGMCNACYKAKHRQENLEHEREVESRYRLNNAERIKRTHDAYASKNPEKLRANYRKFYRTYPDRVTASRMAYAKAHPEKIAAACRRRKALLAGARLGPLITSEQLDARAFACYDQCFYCQSPSWTDWDHRIPLSKGGKDCLANLVPSCKRCNCSKGAKSPKEWLRSRQD